MYKNFIDNETFLVDSRLSEKIMECLDLYESGKVSKKKLSESFWKKIANLSEFLESVADAYDTMTPSEVHEAVDKAFAGRVSDSKVNAIAYMSMRNHGRKLFICHSYHQVRDDVASALYAAKELDENYRACLASGCSKTTCANCDLYVKNGHPDIWVYVFGEDEAVRLCAPREGYPIDQDVIDKWYKDSDTDDEYFEKQEDNALRAELRSLLCVETPWLGYPCLWDLYHNKFGKGHFDKFMDTIDATIESIQSEGQWDVELTTSKVRREDSHIWVSTKAENGSTALSPRRTVYNENPKVRERYEVLCIDRIKLFLSLTFYKYAGLKPMLPVVEESLGNGYTRYAVDYTNGERDSEDEAQDYRATSLLVTDNRKNEPFEFKINFLG